jgi:anti-sigma regulatory factor (Ser/Thr protein kinase)
VSTVVSDRSWVLVVPHHARAAGLIRQRMAADLTTLISTDLLADSVTVTAELVGNAVRHAKALPGEVIRVAWRLRRHADGVDTVDIRVTDGGAADWPRIQAARPEATDGRGLAIVAALAAGWGVHRDGLGQAVWATLIEEADTSGEFGPDRATAAGVEP